MIPVVILSSVLLAVLFYYANQSESQEKAQFLLGSVRGPHHHLDGGTLSPSILSLEENHPRGWFFLFSHPHHFDKDFLRNIDITLPSLEHAFFTLFLDIPEFLLSTDIST